MIGEQRKEIKENGTDPACHVHEALQTKMVINLPNILCTQW